MRHQYDSRTPIGPLERRMLERQTLTVHRVDGPPSEAEQERQWAQQDAEDCERACQEDEDDDEPDPERLLDMAMREYERAQDQALRASGVIR